MKHGFTLAETAIGLALLAVSVLALLAVGLSASRGNTKAASTQAAVYLLNREMQRIVYDAHTDAVVSDDLFSFTKTPFRQATVEIGKERFSWAIYAQAVAGVGSADNRLAKLDGIVTWFDGQRVGYGQLSIRATELVNEAPPNP